MLISGTLAPDQTVRRLPYHPLEAHFPVAMAQDDVEVELRSFCNMGLAPNHRIAWSPLRRPTCKHPSTSR